MSTKCKHLQKFLKKMNKLRNEKSRTDGAKKRKVAVNDAASKLFSGLMGELNNAYNKLLNAEKMIFP